MCPPFFPPRSEPRGEEVAGPLPGGDKLVTRLPLRPAGPRFRQGSEPRPSPGRRRREEPHPSSGRDAQIAARSPRPAGHQPLRDRRGGTSLTRWKIRYQATPGSPAAGRRRTPRLPVGVSRAGSGVYADWPGGFVRWHPACLSLNPSASHPSAPSRGPSFQQSRTRPPPGGRRPCASKGVTRELSEQDPGQVQPAQKRP